MIEGVMDSIVAFATGIIFWGSYMGIIILMAMESTALPIPSEAVMPFAGFNVWQGKMDMFLVILSGGIGSLIGSLISYYIGKTLGRKAIIRYGKYVLIKKKHLEKTERWFEKHGDTTVFFGRFVPVVRHLISYPAGVSNMDLKKFSVYTFIGSVMWCGILAFLGYHLNENYVAIRNVVSSFDIIMLPLIVIFSIIFLVRNHN